MRGEGESRSLPTGRQASTASPARQTAAGKEGTGDSAQDDSAMSCESGEGKSRSLPTGRQASTASPARQTAAGKEGTGDSAPFATSLRAGRMTALRIVQRSRGGRGGRHSGNGKCKSKAQPVAAGGHSVLCPYGRTPRPWRSRDANHAIGATTAEPTQAGVPVLPMPLGSKQGGIKVFGWPRNLDIMGRIRSFGQSLLLMLLRKSDGLAGQS